MSAITLPEFMARTSLKKPLDQAATFVTRPSSPAASSAGALRQPQYRIRFAEGSALAIKAPLPQGRGVAPAASKAGGSQTLKSRAHVSAGASSGAPGYPSASLLPRPNQKADSALLPTTLVKKPSRPQAAQNPKMRLTRRGRLVFRGLPLLTLAALVVLGALTWLMPTEAQSSTTSTVVPTSATVTVMHGDSLWSIAGEIAPGEDNRDVINTIMHINNLTTARVQPGQVLEVPVYSR